jgi:hypothetical protein
MKSFILTVLFASVTIVAGWLWHPQKVAFTLENTKSEAVQLIKNMDNIKAMPRNFRLSTNHYQPITGPLPTRKGLNTLRASGSSQYSERGLQWILAAIPSSQIILVDLRQESHGFIDGAAFSWRGEHNWDNRGKTPEEIEKDQAKKIQGIKQQGFIRFYADKNETYTKPLHIQNVFNEEQLAKRYHIDYLRYYIPDHERPSDSNVDDFIALVKNLSPHTWLHFHCAAGKGRTTSFLAMYDMMRNAYQVSFQDIIKRQMLLGGLDLHPKTDHSFKQQPSEQRYAFLQQFYAYCLANPHLEQSWTAWLTTTNKK